MANTPVAKKGEAELTLVGLQENVMKILCKKMNGRVDSLEKKIDDLGKDVAQNTTNIKDLKDSSELLFKEIQDIKKDATTVAVRAPGTSDRGPEATHG